MGKHGNQGYIGKARQPTTGLEAGTMSPTSFYLERLENDRPYYVPYKQAFITDWRRFGVSASFSASGVDGLAGEGVNFSSMPANYYSSLSTSPTLGQIGAVTKQTIRLRNMSNTTATASISVGPFADDGGTAAHYEFGLGTFQVMRGRNDRPIGNADSGVYSSYGGPMLGTYIRNYCVVLYNASHFYVKSYGSFGSNTTYTAGDTFSFQITAGGVVMACKNGTPFKTWAENLQTDYPFQDEEDFYFTVSPNYLNKTGDSIQQYRWVGEVTGKGYWWDTQLEDMTLNDFTFVASASSVDMGSSLSTGSDSQGVFAASAAPSPSSAKFKTACFSNTYYTGSGQGAFFMFNEDKTPSATAVYGQNKLYAWLPSGSDRNKNANEPGSPSLTRGVNNPDDNSYNSETNAYKLLPYGNGVSSLANGMFTYKFNDHGTNWLGEWQQGAASTWYYMYIGGQTLTSGSYHGLILTGSEGGGCAPHPSQSGMYTTQMYKFLNTSGVAMDGGAYFDDSWWTMRITPGTSNANTYANSGFKNTFLTGSMQLGMFIAGQGKAFGMKIGGETA